MKIGTSPPFSPPAPAITQQRSPVPFLFGGLAAMLGLVAFALLILTCSYCRHSRRLDNTAGERIDAQRDLENGKKDGDSNTRVKVYEEKILVIMAGDEMPTFLATPISTKSSSFDDKNGNFEDNEEQELSYNHGKLPTITENSTSDLIS